MSTECFITSNLPLLKPANTIISQFIMSLACIWKAPRFKSSLCCPIAQNGGCLQSFCPASSQSAFSSSSCIGRRSGLVETSSSISSTPINAQKFDLVITGAGRTFPSHCQVYCVLGLYSLFLRKELPQTNIRHLWHCCSQVLPRHPP